MLRQGDEAALSPEQPPKAQREAQLTAAPGPPRPGQEVRSPGGGPRCAPIFNSLKIDPKGSSLCTPHEV